METVVEDRKFTRLEDLGLVRFEVLPDECSELADLEGDVYNPEANLDIDPAELAQQRKEFVRRIERDGVWGVLGSYRLGVDAPWCRADSVWGFVGEEWKGSGYDADVKGETVKALRAAIRERCRACHGTGKVSP